MESWIQVIVEWINCLGICEQPISRIQQLKENELFYAKLIKQLQEDYTEHQNNDHDDDCLYKFISDEYPEIQFTKNDNSDNELEQIYLTSLLLLNASQKVSFHRPMYKLKNETQILIKQFLELILPYGKNITLDVIRDTILELSDMTPIVPPQTPKDRPLKNFLNSPAAHSAYRHGIMNERTKELRLLKAQLETERFEKVDLQEDIQALEEKIQCLQKKLDSKTEEIKALRAERTLQATPKSARKNKNNSNVDAYLKREIQHLESYNAKLQKDVDRLENDHEQLTCQLTSKERICITFKQKIDEITREMEVSAMQLETKTNELLDLRMQNEELRAHIKGMQKYSDDVDQSFETEHVLRIQSPTTELNVSEAASSIIEIQLRESHEEISKLKTELNNIQEKFNTVLNECNELKRHNELLNEKTMILDEVQMTLEVTEDKLSKRDCQLNIMEMEKQSLQNEMKKLQDIINANKIVLENAGKKNSLLESEICSLKDEINVVKISLVTTEDTLAQTVTSKEVSEMKLISFEEKIKALEKSLAIKTAECVEIMRDSQDKIHELEKKIVVCSNEKKKIEDNFIQKNNDFENMTIDLTDKNSEINSLKSDITRLEHQLDSNQSALKETEIKLCELSELRDELQSQLIQERDNSAALFEKKRELECNLLASESTKSRISDQFSALQVNFQELQQKYNDTQDKVNFIEENYNEIKEKFDLLQSEKEKLTAQLFNANGEISQLRNIQENLQNRLIQEHECCTKLVTEKAELEHTMLINERQNIDQSEKISMLEAIIDKSNVELKQIQNKYNDCNVNYSDAIEKIQNLMTTITQKNSKLEILNDKILELEEIATNLKIDLQRAKDEYETISAEKIALEIAVQSRDDDKNKLTTKISGLQTDLCESHNKIEKLHATYEILQQQCTDDTQKIKCLNEEIKVLNDKNKEISHECNSLQNKIADMDKAANSCETEYKDLQKQIDELRQLKNQMIDQHQDQQKASAEIISSLEKKLLTAENTCETLKSNIKLQEESVCMLKSQLQEITNEEIETKLKMKELLEGFQEVRISQGAVLEAQSKTLADKSLELDVLTAQHLKMKEEFETKLKTQETLYMELSSQSTSLKEIINKNAVTIQELEKTRDLESCRLNKFREKYESIETDIKAIGNICEILLNENYQSDNDVYSKQSFNNPEAEKLAEMLKNIYVKMKAHNEMVLRLEKENTGLKINGEADKLALENVLTDEKNNAQLLDKLNSMDLKWTKQNMFLSDVIRKKEDLQVVLKETISTRDEVKNNFTRVRELWNVTLSEVKKNISTNSSACDEVKHMEAKSVELEQLMNDLNDRQLKNLQPLIKILFEIFMSTEKKLNQIYTLPMSTTEVNVCEIDFSDEVSVLQADIKMNEVMMKDLILIQEKINQLRDVLNSYEVNMKSGIVKREATVEEKLQIQLEKITKEKKELKDKMDAVRVRNSKLEKNMDDLRNENKKIKAELSEVSKNNAEVEKLTTQIEQLQKNIELLKEEKEQLEKRPKEEDFDARLNDIHNEYGQKLEKIKQKMKAAYSEQVTKLNAEQEKAMAEKVASMRAKMEQQCKKYSEDIAKYKAHISDMSSQFWDVGEKLLAEKQEKETAMQQLRELQRKHQIAMTEANQSIQSYNNQANSMNFDRDYNHDRVNLPTRPSFRTVQVIEEQTTTTRRHSVKSIQAMGNAFNAEDEEGEVFDNVYLTDLKEGKFRGIDSVPDSDRISELRMRNSLCRPHLKSSYAVETHFHPLSLTEEDIKSGLPHDDTFNDSLSQSLLPGQKTKKKDRTQTSYKRPGPPTPSKNGGRLSLQGNELKSPTLKILRERNSDRRTTATPKRLKDFFATSLSRRQDENIPATPKGRRLSSIFRKTKPTDKS